MDLIERQAAIEAIKRHKHDILDGEKLDKGIEYGYAAAHNHICEVISHMPTAKRVRKRERERKNMIEWIPVTERQPGKSGHYLVTLIDDNNGEPWVSADDYFVYGWDDFGDEVVAWAEPPEPWKGEEG